MRKRKGDERLPELWRQWKGERDQDARNDLIERYYPLAPLTTNRFWHKLSGYMEREDAEAEAALALMEAVESFDPAVGTAFESWAITRIRGHLLDLWRRHATRARIAQVVAIEDLQEEASLVTQPGDDPELLALQRCEQQAIEEHLKVLEQVDLLVLEGILWGDLTLAEIGEALGISESKAAYRRDRAVRKLREKLEE